MFIQVPATQEDGTLIPKIILTALIELAHFIGQKEEEETLYVQNMQNAQDVLPIGFDMVQCQCP